jgi:hypothetical protein
MEFLVDDQSMFLKGLNQLENVRKESAEVQMGVPGFDSCLQSALPQQPFP